MANSLDSAESGREPLGLVSVHSSPGPGLSSTGETLPASDGGSGPPETPQDSPDGGGDRLNSPSVSFSSPASGGGSLLSATPHESPRVHEDREVILAVPSSHSSRSSRRRKSSSARRNTKSFIGGPQGSVRMPRLLRPFDPFDPCLFTSMAVTYLTFFPFLLCLYILHITQNSPGWQTLVVFYGFLDWRYNARTLSGNRKVQSPPWLIRMMSSPRPRLRLYFAWLAHLTISLYYLRFSSEYGILGFFGLVYTFLNLCFFLALLHRQACQRGTPRRASTWNHFFRTAKQSIAQLGPATRDNLRSTWRKTRRFVQALCRVPHAVIAHWFKVLIVSLALLMCDFILFCRYGEQSVFSYYMFKFSLDVSGISTIWCYTKVFLKTFCAAFKTSKVACRNLPLNETKGSGATRAEILIEILAKMLDI